MTNDETIMTKESRMTKAVAAAIVFTVGRACLPPFVIRASSFLRHYGLGISHLLRFRNPQPATRNAP